MKLSQDNKEINNSFLKYKKWSEVLEILKKEEHPQYGVMHFIYVQELELCTKKELEAYRSMLKELGISDCNG